MHTSNEQDAGAEETKGSGHNPAQCGGAALNPQPSTSQNIFDDLTIENYPPEQLNALIDSLEKTLALEEGKKLTDHVNQILIDTLRALAALIKIPKETVEEEDEGEDEEKEEETPGDNRLTPDNLNDKIYDTINSLLSDPNRVLNAAQRLSEEEDEDEDDEVDRIVNVFSKQYCEYFNSWEQEIGSILDFYTNEQKKPSYKNKVLKGYGYDGPRYCKENTSDSFIKLIDGLALYDISYIERIKEEIKPEIKSEDSTPTGTEKIELIINKSYEIFEEIQSKQYGLLNEQLTEKAEMLYEAYLVNRNSDEDTEDDSNESKTDDENLYDENLNDLKRLLLTNLSIDIEEEPDNSKIKSVWDSLSEKCDQACPNQKYKMLLDIEVIRQELQDYAAEVHYDIKALKKLTHHFAQDTGHPSLIKDGRGDKHACKFRHLKANEAKPEENETKSEANEAKHEANEDTLGFQVNYYVERNHSDRDDLYLISELKQRRRKIKSQNSSFSKFASVFTGFGEGSVAAFGMMIFLGGIIAGSAGTAIPVIVILVGVGGFICNYFLFKDEIKNLLDETRLPNDIEEKETEKISWTNLFLSIGSTCTGIAYGALSAYAICTAIGVVGIVGIAITFLPATCTAIAMGTLLFMAAKRFKMIEGCRSFYRKKYLLPLYAHRDKSKDLTGFKWFASGCYFIVGRIMRTIPALMAIAGTVLLTIIMRKIFKASCVTLFTGISEKKTAVILANITAGINAIFSLPFAAQSFFETLNAVTSRFRGTFCKKNTESGKPSAQQLNNHQVAAKRVRFFQNGATYSTVTVNAAGQDGLTLSQADALKSVCPHIVSAFIAVIVATIYSAWPNAQNMKKSLKKANHIPTDSISKGNDATNEDDTSQESEGDRGSFISLNQENDLSIEPKTATSRSMWCTTMPSIFSKIRTANNKDQSISTENPGFFSVF